MQLFFLYICTPLQRRVRLRVRTPPFHGGDTGSNPVRGTRYFSKPAVAAGFSVSVKNA